MSSTHAASASPPGPIIRFRGVTKRFPGVQALTDVTFDVMPGSVHALCGENGAGKSTLGRILAGVTGLDAGEIWVEGRRAEFDSPRDALAAGIGIVHQELAYCGNLSVAENLCLGDLPARRLVVSRREMARRAREMLQAIGADIDVRQPMSALGIAQQQLVQIAAAVGSGARIIVFDEPTSSLSRHEAQNLYTLLGQLKARGVTCLYVSHRMPEIFALCDTATVLRDGRHVTTRPTATLDEAALVQAMIGRTLDEYFPAHLQAKPGEVLLRVEDLSSPGRFQGVSFSVRAGEVLGLAGLVGAGRSSIAQALFGLDPHATGSIEVGGKLVRISRPDQAVALGIGLVPEDRKRQGLVMQMRAYENISLPTLPALSRLGWIRRAAEHSLAERFMRALRVRAPSPDFVTAGLSGGNQQKLVLAKWLAGRCRILVLDEPTRGVDVGAKAEIHALVDELAARGNAIILISSELPELINLSTRILVLRAGRLAGELGRDLADQESTMRMMAGLRGPS